MDTEIIDINIDFSVCDYIPIQQQVAAYLAVSGPCLLVGYKIHNMSTTVADTLRITDGGNLVSVDRVNNNISDGQGPAIPAIRIHSGITLTQVNGTIEGTLYVIKL